MIKNNNLQELLKTLFSILLVARVWLGGPALAADDNLWQRVQSQLGLYTLQHQRIDVERHWYQRNPDYMRRVSARAEPYQHYVVAEIERRGLPMELALLPIMESAYDPFAYSHGRAAGIWQIIPGTGGDLGLTQDWWYDGRRDVRASTDAALNYLDDLAQAFDGDWLKALAAYNAGKRRVNNAVAANREKGRSTDFWSLQLPTETRNYVPRLLALSQIIAEPESYGIALTPTANQPYFGVVDTGGQIDLVQAASAAPAPIGREPMVKRLGYRVRSGDSLAGIAGKFNIGVDEIIGWNNKLEGKKYIHPGQVLTLYVDITGS